MTNSLGIRLPLTLTTASVIALTGTLAALPVQAAPAEQVATSAAPAAGEKVQLTRDPGTVVRAATVPVLDSTSTARRTPGGAQVGPRTPTSPFKMVAVTWRGEEEPDLAVRTRNGDSWTPWQELEHLHDAPNGKDPKATDLLWVGTSDGVQVRNTGDAASGLELVLINPGVRASDATVKPNRVVARAGAGNDVGKKGGARFQVSRAAATSAPEPVLLGRAKWGANNAWRNGKPRYNTLMKQVHVHHTASSNNYTRADVPGILRGIYRYHTKSLGWFDIGYNFLVDKFGRTWVGRSGGPRKLVRGAHTLGFNQSSVGIAVIGNFENAAPKKIVNARIIRLSAWKLDKYGKDAQGTVMMRSQGSDRYPNGKWVRLPIIDGHRDTNQTACPGAALYAQLPVMRKLAQKRINQFN